MYNKQQQQKYVDPRSACYQIWHCHPLIVSHKRKVAVWLRETNPLTFVSCALENFDVHHYSWDPYSGLTAKITRHISHKYYRTLVTYLSCIHGHAQNTKQISTTIHVNTTTSRRCLKGTGSGDPVVTN